MTFIDNIAQTIRSSDKVRRRGFVMRSCQARARVSSATSGGHEGACNRFRCRCGMRTAFLLVCEAIGFLKEGLHLFLITHSPLMMVALEDEFATSDPESNKWFDFDTNMPIRKEDIAEPSFSQQQAHGRQILSELGFAMYKESVNMKADGNHIEM